MLQPKAKQETKIGGGHSHCHSAYAHVSACLVSQISHLQKRPSKLKAGIAIPLTQTAGPSISYYNALLLVSSSYFSISSLFTFLFHFFLLFSIVLADITRPICVLSSSFCFLFFLNCGKWPLGFCIFYSKIDESLNLGMWACMVFWKIQSMGNLMLTLPERTFSCAILDLGSRNLRTAVHVLCSL